MRRSVYLFVLLLLAARSAPGPLVYAQPVSGGVTAVFAQGDRAYLGEDSTFVILDVSDPAQPVVLSRTLLKDANNGLRDIVVDGEEAYLIGDGFFMYDISDPAHPESLFADPTLKGRGVDVAGGYAYVASRHVTVFNVQDPSDPVRLSEFVTNNRTWDVLVRGDTLYATYDSGPVIDDCEWALFVLDVSDKTNLQALSFYKPRGCSNSVAVHGDILYLAIDIVIQVLDVANLADLTLIKELPLFGACTLQSNEDLLIAWRVISYNLLWAGVLHVNSAGNTADELGNHPIPYNVGAPANSPSAWRHWDQEYDGCGWIKCHSPYGATMTVGAVLQNDVRYFESSLGPSAWEDIQANHPEQQSIALDKRDYRYETSPYNTPLIKPDVVAPSGVISTFPGDNYGFHARTSSAAPHVAGAAALMLSADPTLTVEEITETLETTAKALGASGKDYEYGSGRIDVYKAITFGSPKRGTPEATASATPQTYLLHENFPDPFNPSTRVHFDLPEAVQVSLVVYDVMGREVARLIDHRSMNAGTHAVTWEASGLPSGVYLYQLTAGAYRQTKSMTLLK